MGLDAGAVLKRPILCPHCNQHYYFTLRAIGDNRELERIPVTWKRSLHIGSNWCILAG